MRGPQRGKVRLERRLRRQATDAETKLWFALRDRRLGGFKFVRQEAIGSYIVDFVCSREKKLIVEVDGGQHAENTRDRARSSAHRGRLSHCAFLELGRAEQSGRCFVQDPC